MTDTIRPIAIAVIRRGNEILVFKEHDPIRDHTYYRPLGGGIEFAEFAEDALKREFIEELNEPLTDIRPLTVLESIFVLKGAMKHEHVFVYEAAFADLSAYDRTDLKIIDDPESEVMWVAVEDFKGHKLTLYPRGLLALI
jgi:8-oxo-dGTP pyrophosphatase MutT (NUDIX family)